MRHFWVKHQARAQNHMVSLIHYLSHKFPACPSVRWQSVRVSHGSGAWSSSILWTGGEGDWRGTGQLKWNPQGSMGGALQRHYTIPTGCSCFLSLFRGSICLDASRSNSQLHLLKTKYTGSALFKPLATTSFSVSRMEVWGWGHLNADIFSEEQFGVSRIQTP